MNARELVAQLRDRGAQPALRTLDGTESYAELAQRCDHWADHLDDLGLARGAVVSLASDYSPDAIALFLALLSRGYVAALLPTHRWQAHRDEIPVACSFVAEPAGLREVGEPTRRANAHPLLRELAKEEGGGFVIFTSGTTGAPKAVLHAADRFLSKFDAPAKPLRSLAFLLFDHIAGVDTLFYALCSGGSLSLCEGREPDAVCRVIERDRVEVLPVSPTFLKLLVLTGAAERHDLSSLTTIAYGSEPMAPAILELVRARLPGVRLLQRYGTSELGSPRSRSRADGSTWLEIKGDEVETRVVDGVLWVRSPGAMLGYLNAPQPFDESGWYCTGDRVVREGSWLRVLGRESQLINVGGEKVAPARVEEVLQEIPWVVDALVDGVPHPMMGQVVRACLELTDDAPESAADLRFAVRSHCRDRLARHQVPVRIERADGPLSDARGKKRRS